MPEIKFYNLYTKQLEAFEPSEPGEVRIYNCGPTVYKRQHIGNMRRFLFSDFLRRGLEFFGYEVREITNITDVGHLTQDEIDAGEDKLEKEARENKTTPQDIAEKQIKQFKADLQILNIQEAHKYPRATQHIDQMIDMIRRLIERGYAYKTESGVYFDVSKATDYGRLSGNTLEALEAGARVEARKEKKHPSDFALWILNEDQIQLWDSPWGRGYPGWHIECSAMSIEYLGPNIDIHTGGEDNKFPHHENEIAQSEGASDQPFVRFWMHNGHLLLKGDKLSKRGGDQITLDTIIENGYSPLAFRLLVFGSHYRSKMDFSWEALGAAQKNLDSIANLVWRLAEADSKETAAPDPAAVKSFATALADDLNTPGALAVVNEYISASNARLDAGTADPSVILVTLKKVDEVLGIIGLLEKESAEEDIPAEIEQLANDRLEARKSGDFEKADQLRREIESAGYTVEDTSDGSRIKKSSGKPNT